MYPSWKGLVGGPKSLDSRIHDPLMEGFSCVWVVFLPRKSLETA